MNIVRIRYMESPVFMSVSSLVNQYSIESEISSGVFWSWGSSPGTDNTIGGAGRYANRPTITYAPMIGQKFAQSILTPIKPPAVLAMIESSWKVNTVFPMMFQSINGIRNRIYVGANRQMFIEAGRVKS